VRPANIGVFCAQVKKQYPGLSVRIEDEYKTVYVVKVIPGKSKHYDVDETRLTVTFEALQNLAMPVKQYVSSLQYTLLHGEC